MLVSGSAFEVNPDGMNFLRTLVRGTFMEKLDLHNFPFDVQDLTIRMGMSFITKEGAMWVPWSEAYDPASDKGQDKSFVIWNRQFSAVTDFSMRRILCEFYISDDDRSVFQMQMQLVRLPWGILGRIASMCSFLGFGTLATFSMPPLDNNNDRTAFLVTAILAFVAFQFIVSSKLPDTPYLSLLDKFTMSTFAFLTGLMLMSAAFARVEFEDPATRQHVDNILFFVSLACISVINVSFYLMGYFARRREMNKVSMDATQLHAANVHAEDDVIKVYGTQRMHDSDKATTEPRFVSFAAEAVHY